MIVAPVAQTVIAQTTGSGDGARARALLGHRALHQWVSNADRATLVATARTCGLFRSRTPARTFRELSEVSADLGPALRDTDTVLAQRLAEPVTDVTT